MKINSRSLFSYRFNSNLVRLKVRPELPLYRRYRSFQFQSGAIKRGIVKSKLKIKTSFNSNLVRLKVNMTVLKVYELSRFNSNLVRLKDIGKYGNKGYGSVRFNSNLVRLKGVISVGI